MGRESNYLVGTDILAPHVGASQMSSGPSLSISPQNNHRRGTWNILA